MFLVTSADQRYWDKSQEILFIHEGCKTYSQRKEFESLKYSVLPYPWEDAKKFTNDIIYIENLCKKILPRLGRELNKIHNIERSEKYWKIILFPWLLYQVYLLYDRYLQINSAITSNLVTNTYVLQYTRMSEIIPTYPWGNFLHYWLNDEYNQYIYGRIIEITNALPYTVADHQPKLPAYMPPKSFSVDPNTNLLKKICITINDKVAAPISLKYSTIQIIQPYMSNSDTLKLSLKIKLKIKTISINN